MATNPRIPEERDLHPKLPPQQRPGAPWVLIGIIVAAAILVALILWLPRTPRAINPATGAQVPPQPTGNQLQFQNLKLVSSPLGNAEDLDGVVTNNGNTDVTGIAVNAAFKGTSGQTLETVPTRVMGVEGGNSGGATQDLTQAPIKPGQTRAIRLEFTRLPEGWNHQLPALTVTAVTAAGNPGQNALEPPITRQQRPPGANGGENGANNPQKAKPSTSPR